MKIKLEDIRIDSQREPNMNGWHYRFTHVPTGISIVEFRDRSVGSDGRDPLAFREECFQKLQERIDATDDTDRAEP